MKNIMKYVIVGAVAVGLMASMPAISYAKGKGHSGKGNAEWKDEWKHKHGKHRSEVKTTGVPYGWSRGRKTGWRGGSVPPGWQKWDNDRRDDWRRDRVESLQNIDGYLIRYKFPEPQSEQIVSAFDRAIAGGMAINEARKKIVDGLKDGDSRRNLMIDAAQTSLDLLR